MKTTYFVTMQDKIGNTAYDEFCGAFDSLEEASDEANSLWSHLTQKEQEKRIVSVVHVDIPDGTEDEWDYALENGVFVDLELK